MISFRSLFAFLVFTGISAVVHATQLDSTVNKMFDRCIYISGTDTLRYRLLRPEHVQAGEKYPVVLYLHGAGERGRDNNRNLIHVPKLLVDSAGRKNYPCFMIVPQCPEGKRWVEVNWGDSTETIPAEISISEKLAMEVLDSLVKNLPIDSNRIYLTGMSMGGFGTWDLLCRYPNKFACGAPLCGGGDEKQADKLVSTPIWAFHGDKDRVVIPQRSINMVNAVKSDGGNCRLTMYPGGTHNCWDETYTDPALYKWMFSQHR